MIFIEDIIYRGYIIFIVDYICIYIYILYKNPPKSSVVFVCAAPGAWFWWLRFGDWGYLNRRMVDGKSDESMLK